MKHHEHGHSHLHPHAHNHVETSRRDFLRVLMGGALAVMCLAIAKVTFIDPLSARFALLAAPKTIDFTVLIVVLMVSCVAVSAVGSGLTLRRFLRV